MDAKMMTRGIAAQASRLGRLVRDDFLRQASVLFGLTLAMNGLNFAYQVLMAQVLGPEAFGLLGVLFAILLIVALPAGALQTSVASTVARLEERSPAAVDPFVNRLRFLLAVGCTVLIGGVAAASGALAPVFGTTPLLVTLMGAGVVLSLLTPFYVGVLQGRRCFAAMGTTQVLGPGVKLLLSLALVAIGWGVFGAVLGTVLGLAVGVAFGGFVARVSWSRPRGTEHSRRFVGELAPAFVTLTGFAALTNLDVILVKVLFPEAQAGLYAGTAVLGKILLFLPTAVGAVLLPTVAEGHARGEDTRGVLLKALALTALLAAGVVLAYAAVPELILGLLLSAEYVGAAPLLPWLGVSMALMSLVNVMLLYALGAGRHRLACALIAFVPVEIALVLLFHASLVQVAVAVAVTAGLVLAALGVAVARPHGNASFRSTRS